MAVWREGSGATTARRELIDVAMGRAPADRLVVTDNLVNVCTGEIHPASVAIVGDRIAAVGDVDYARGPDTDVVDARGRYVVPGLVDGHLHSYHSYLGVEAYVEVMLSHGVTTTTDGFYGQAIVAGMEAVRFFKEAFAGMPLRVLFLVPTLAYLQNRELGLTPAPGISAENMFEILGWEGCLGLEEPPFLPVVEKYEEFLDLFEEALRQRKVVTGHAAGIGYRQMQAYAAMGVYTDHEMVERTDALNKARAGMKLLARQGSGAVDVPEVVKAFTEARIDPRAYGFCADLASPEKLTREGGVDENVRVAIANGVPPIVAIQMATLNVAEVFYSQHDVGCIAPGRFADMLFVEDLARFDARSVLVGGRWVVREGDFVAELPSTTYPESFYGTVKLQARISPSDLVLRAGDDAPEVEVRVIRLTEGSLVTHEDRAVLPATDGEVLGSVEQDVLAMAMIDRFGKGTGIGLGFVRGFGLKRGALASSVNAVCENVVVLGTNADDMALAVNKLAEVGGGKIVVADGEVLALVELSVLGLLSEDPLDVVMSKFDRVFAAIADLGCRLRSPFSQLEFCCACGEIGHIKLSEEGLMKIDPPEKLSLVVG